MTLKKDHNKAISDYTAFLPFLHLLFSRQHFKLLNFKTEYFLVDFMAKNIYY